VRAASFLTFFEGHGEPVGSLAFSADGRLMASGDDGGTIRVWTLDGSAPPVTLKEQDWPVSELGFDSDGRLVWADTDGGMRLWHPSAGASSVQLPVTGIRWDAVRLSPDGNLLATTTCEGDIFVWAWPGFAQLWPGFGALWHTHAAGCSEFVVWSHDGRYLAVGGGSPERQVSTSVYIWRVGDAKPLRVLEGHRSWPTGAAFSPDGKHLATGGYDGEIIVWDFIAGAARHRMLGHTDTVTGVTYSPSGKVVASASEDASVRIWDAATGQERLALRDSQQRLQALAFHPDGKWLAAAGNLYPVGRIQPPSATQAPPEPTGMILMWAASEPAQTVPPQR
jgi:WD40 repeat protein